MDQAPSPVLFFFNDTATTEIYTLSLHDALPISVLSATMAESPAKELPRELTLFQNFPNPFNPSTAIKYFLPFAAKVRLTVFDLLGNRVRSAEHTSELQSLTNLACRLLLEKTTPSTLSASFLFVSAATSRSTKSNSACLILSWRRSRSIERTTS